jgi:EmrB/QacA subfamily drug resistance transporter
MSATATATPTPQRRWLTLAAVVFAVFVTTLDNTVVNVALPSIQRDLHLGVTGLAWVVNGYILSFAVLLLTGGRLADSFGRRRAFLGGLAVFTVASALAGLAPGGGVLIAARVAQGVGAALMTPPTLAIISDSFPDERERATAIGIWAAVAAAAFAIGPVVGGVVVDHVHWSWIFFVNVPVGIAGLAMGARVIPESREPGAERRLDLPGLALSVLALTSLTYALLRANELGWGSPAIVALLTAAVAGLGLFVWVERRAAAPMVDLSLFRIPAFTGANVLVMVVNLGTFGVLFYTSLYLQEVLGFSAVAAGATFLPWVGLIILLAPLGGRLAARVPVRTLVSVGVALMGLALLLFSGLDEHSTFADMLPPLLLGGLGGALTTQISSVVIGSVPASKAGVASGIHNTFRETGGALGIAVIGAVFAAGRSDALAGASSAAHAFVSGYADGLRVAGLLSIAAAVIALLTLPRGVPGEPEGVTSVAAGGIGEPLADAA